MAYKRSWTGLPDLPQRCPLCVEKRTDAAAVDTHNKIAAATGCRSYPPRRP